MRLRKCVAATFWDRVMRDWDHKCWEWQACKQGDGYGNVVWNGRAQLAHRVAFMLTTGPIPEGMHVLHSCDNPACCNPSHLRLGTHRENMTDREVRGRSHWHTRKRDRHGRFELVAGGGA